MFDIPVLTESAASTLTKCISLKRDENLLVVCDRSCYEIGEAFRIGGEMLCREAVMVLISDRKNSNNELPAFVDQLFSQFDVVVILASKTLCSSNLGNDASRNRTRFAVISGITPEVFVRTMNADWNAIGTYTRSITADISSASEIRIVTAIGTDFIFETGGRRAFANDGLIREAGDVGDLPGGEVRLAPTDGSGNGKLVFDGSFSFIGKLDSPLTVIVKNGEVTQIEDHKIKTELRRFFNYNGQSSRKIAEFGIGTLDTAIISGNMQEDRKVDGTIHVSFGNRVSAGTSVSVPVYIEGVLKNPTIYLDGKLWMQSGITV